MNSFKIGDEAYLTDGRQVAVVGLSDYSYIVTELYVDEYGESHKDNHYFEAKHLFKRLWSGPRKIMMRQFLR